MFSVFKTKFQKVLAANQENVSFIAAVVLSGFLSFEIFTYTKHAFVGGSLLWVNVEVVSYLVSVIGLLMLVGASSILSNNDRNFVLSYAALQVLASALFISLEEPISNPLLNSAYFQVMLPAITAVPLLVFLKKWRSTDESGLTTWLKRLVVLHYLVSLTKGVFTFLQVAHYQLATGEVLNAQQLYADKVLKSAEYANFNGEFLIASAAIWLVLGIFCLDVTFRTYLQATKKASQEKLRLSSRAIKSLI